MKAKAAFRTLIALSACLALAGCRSAGVSPSNRPLPPSEPQASFRIDEFVREHNRNARLIKTVNAKPSITVTAPADDSGKVKSYALNGRLMVSQPYDFKLLVAHKMTTDVANIGSNKDEFWFWVKDNPDKKIYRCAYEDLATSDLAATYQPDWIVSALGLKPITRDEAASAKVLPGVTPGTTILRFPPSRDPSSAYTRELIVDEATHRLAEFRVYDRDGKTLIGQARIKAYLPVALKSDPSADPAEAPSPTTCYFPDKFTLDWKREKLTLDIAMSGAISGGPTVNKEFSETLLANFVPPQISGYQAEDIAAMTRTQPRGETGEGDTTLRETMPPPEPAPSRRRTSTSRDGGVTLGHPVEIEGARLQSADEPEPAPSRDARPASRRSAPRPVAPASTAPLMLPVLEDPIGAAVPRPPQSAFAQTADAADLIPSSPLER